MNVTEKHIWKLSRSQSLCFSTTILHASNHSFGKTLSTSVLRHQLCWTYPCSGITNISCKCDTKCKEQKGEKWKNIKWIWFMLDTIRIMVLVMMEKLRGSVRKTCNFSSTKSKTKFVLLVEKRQINCQKILRAKNCSCWQNKQHVVQWRLKRWINIWMTLVLMKFLW